MSSPGIICIDGIEALMRKCTEQTDLSPSRKKPEVAYPGFEHLPEEIKALIKKIIVKVRRSNMTRLTPYSAKKMEFFLHLIGASLEESNCIDVGIKQEIEETRAKLLNILGDTPLFSDEDMRYLRENKFSLPNILYLALNMESWMDYRKDAIAELHKDVGLLRSNKAEYQEILIEKRYFHAILKQNDGLKKLQMLIDFDGSYDQEDMITLSPNQIVNILMSRRWKDKLEYLMNKMNEAFLKELKKLGFEGAHLEQIVKSPEWEGRLAYLTAQIKEISYLINRCKFRPIQVTKILCSDQWIDKLEYLTSISNLKSLIAQYKTSELTEVMLRTKWEENLNKRGAKTN